MKRRSIILTLALASTLPFALVAQGDTTSPVGFTTAAELANSDTLLSVPFLRRTEFTGTVQSVTGSVITVAESPGWTTDQFVYAAGSQPKTYFVLIGAGGTSNPKEGHNYTITSNDANSLTLDTSGDSLSGITANTQVSVIPYWTLGSIFPTDKINLSFTPTTLTSAYKTQILVPDNTANGINLANLSFFFSNNVDGTSGNVGWRLVGDNLTDHGDDPLMPDSYFIVRNLHQAPTLSLRSLGNVLMDTWATGLRTSTTGPQDNAVSMLRPIPVTLNQTGLTPADGSFVGTVRTNAVKDQLLLFNNAQVKHNKKPSAIYFYYTGPSGPAGWRLRGGGTADHGSDVIPAGSAIVIRKARTAGGATVFWTNAPTY